MAVCIGISIAVYVYVIHRTSCSKNIFIYLFFFFAIFPLSKLTQWSSKKKQIIFQEFSNQSNIYAFFYIAERIYMKVFLLTVEYILQITLLMIELHRTTHTSPHIQRRVKTNSKRLFPQ